MQKKILTKKDLTECFVKSAESQAKLAEEMHQLNTTLRSILQVLAQSVHMSMVVNNKAFGINDYNLQPVFPPTKKEKTGDDKEEENTKLEDIAKGLENQRKLGINVPGGRGEVNPPVAPEEEAPKEDDYVDPEVDAEVELYKKNFAKNRPCVCINGNWHDNICKTCGGRHQTCDEQEKEWEDNYQKEKAARELDKVVFIPDNDPTKEDTSPCKIPCICMNPIPSSPGIEILGEYQHRCKTCRGIYFSTFDYFK